MSPAVLALSGCGGATGTGPPDMACKLDAMTPAGSWFNSGYFQPPSSGRSFVRICKFK
ncbi:MAG: hypothetical protein FJ087_16705 [Deltaproteobacteria bacterium]|nr:hypothetical protein [Deltaproteobacteria bacterium]